MLKKLNRIFCYSLWTQFILLSLFFNVLKIKNKGIKESDVRKYLSEQNEYTLHKPITRKFKRNKVVVYGIDDTWQLDLVDMQKFSGEIILGFSSEFF